MKRITVLAIIMSVPVSSFTQSEIPTIVTIHEKAPAIEKIFTEPFETLAIITNDGKAITVTNQLANQVRSSIGELENYLKSIAHDFDTIELIIHNHPTPTRWSKQDKRFYNRLKREGFKGDFVLYFPWSKSMRYMEDNENERDH
jgi:3-methyladenine DNA glycosylase Tag